MGQRATRARQRTQLRRRLENRLAVGTRDLSVLQRAADAALYDGKHSGRSHLATKEHATRPSTNGRHAGRSDSGWKQRWSVTWRLAGEDSSPTTAPWRNA
ncbi:hypothetical protein [Streptomyces scopuliridis]|uniref:hypothetical protein n=1 Tax=Streptomyces scopuliridis TaxID=452529 RepID=UPI0036A8BE78